MLNKISFLVVIIFFAIFLYFFFLAKKSQKEANLEVNTSTLQLCPNKPNCVNSEDESDSAHFIEPFSYADLVTSEHERKKESEIIWQTLLITLKKMGAKIEIRTSHYLAASFTSSFFGFVDDFEARLDEKVMVIHFRSASRTGTSDFGVNRKRVNNVMDLLNENIQKVKTKTVK